MMRINYVTGILKTIVSKLDTCTLCNLHYGLIKISNDGKEVSWLYKLLLVGSLT